MLAIPTSAILASVETADLGGSQTVGCQIIRLTGIETARGCLEKMRCATTTEKREAWGRLHSRYMRKVALQDSWGGVLERVAARTSG
jgi:hypothetical protein